jgi:DNA ligase 1
MNTPWSVIQRLESDNSRLAKESILEQEMLSGNDELFEGLKMALDSLVTFGVKKVPTHGGPDGQGLPWTAFKALADRLANRELTGHDARDAIELCLGAATKEQWNDWYRRILIKDMRAGFTQKTVNTVAKKTKKKNYAISIFECQLAHGFEDHEKKANGRRLIEVKLDGVRVLTVVYPNGRVDQYSRNGKELVNFELIKEQFARAAASITKPLVFDGEVMSSSFQDLMKQVHRKTDVNASDAVLHLFDVLPLEDFQKGHYRLKQSERSAWLKQWFEQHMNLLPNVSVLDQALVDLSTDEGKKLFAMYNKSAIENGYEGIMLKDPDADYECKRTTHWLKLKPFIEVSLAVTSVEEGTGRNEGRLGAFVCEGEDSGKNIQVNVGSGFSDTQRDEFWQSHGSENNIVGQIVEVRADAVTKNQDGSYSLRFPRFLRFRGFEQGEKL